MKKSIFISLGLIVVVGIIFRSSTFAGEGGELPPCKVVGGSTCVEYGGCSVDQKCFSHALTCGCWCSDYIDCDCVPLAKATCTPCATPAPCAFCAFTEKCYGEDQPCPNGGICKPKFGSKGKRIGCECKV